MSQVKQISPDWIAYVGPIDFPEGGAAARRVLGMSQSLVLAGYKVTVVSGYLASGRVEGEATIIQPGIESVQINERSAEHLPKLLKFVRYFTMGRRSRDWFEQQQDWPKAIVIYSGYSPYLLNFIAWAKRRGIKIIFDAVEWYAAESRLGFWMSPYLMNTEFAMRYLVPKADGVICISSALQHYYQAKKRPTVRIPPTLTFHETTSTLDQLNRPKLGSGPVKLFYAGSPGKKDRLDKIAIAVAQVNQPRGKQEDLENLAIPQREIELHIVGLNQLEFNAYMEQSPESQKWNAMGGATAKIICHGRITHAEVSELLKQAHFTIFVREQNRVSEFGFPTKYVESLALGCPVITNLTSDLSLYHSVDTGLLVSSSELNDIESALRSALALSDKRYKEMTDNAHRKGRSSFDVEIFQDALRKFIASLVHHYE